MMAPLLSQIFPILYGACVLLLLWQAFRIMAQGFNAMPRSGDPGLHGPSGPAEPEVSARQGDRTGRLTIHPELLDADGQITREDLLTVRFGGDHEPPRLPTEPD